MKIRNNSKEREWMGYVCPGGKKVDIPKDSEFEVGEKEGLFLLRLLGAPGWLTLVDEDAPVEPVVEVEIVAPEKEEVAAEEPKVEKPKEEPKKPEAEEPVEAKEKPFCDACPSKGGRHKLLCPNRK